MKEALIIKQIEMGTCLYCQKHFVPSKRWSHIYCSGSCRTKACRERKNGISGTLQTKKKATSVSDLSHLVIHLTEDLKAELYDLKDEILSLKDEVKQLKAKANETDIWLREILSSVNQIKQELGHGLVRDLSETIYEWRKDGMSAIPKEIKTIKQDIYKIMLMNDKILQGQDEQVWITGLASTFGPALGDKIIGTIKLIFGGNKDVPLDKKLDALAEAVNELKKTG